ncbi:MAG: tetratricopeptide repeat protein [Gemmataceae bacterium]
MLLARLTVRPWLIAVLVGILATGSWWYLKRAHNSSDVEVGPVTFNRDVAPVVFSKCATCHHAGEAAPFNLLTYDDVKRRGRQIVDVTQRRFMPPWLPSEDHGDFIGSRRLTDRELLVIKKWVDSGTPVGEAADLPAAPSFTEGWQAGPPDLVLETPDYKVSAEGSDVFRNFVIPIKSESSRWVQSIELRPTNPRVTHHARLGVDNSNESLRRDAEDDEPGYAGMAWGQDPDGQLVIWTPGMIATAGTPGIAWRLSPNTCIVLHAHLQPTGKHEVMKFRIGIRFAKEPPNQMPAMLRVGSCNIDIPAGARHHEVKDQYTLPIDVDVQSILPHAHSLCQQVHLVAERPDGSRESLISIEHFDENWHDLYRYREPVRLPRGTKLISTFVYDNTDGNVRNRNYPARRVVYGSNANDEMADIYLQVTAGRPDQRALLMEHYKHYDAQSLVTGHLRTLSLYPNNPWSQEGMASCYIGLGQIGKGIAILEERLKTGPKAVSPIVSLGMAQLLSGNFAKAEERQREAIAMDKDFPLAWFALGKALVMQKKPGAEEAFRRAMELAPAYVDSYLNLADLLMQRGEFDQASELCRAALNRAPETSGIYLKLAEISAKRKDYVESLEYCKQAQRLAPYSHPPKVLLAVFCCANGDNDPGAALLREVRSELPSHPMPPLILGQLARREQQTMAAKGYLAAAASLPLPDNWPDSHKHRFQVLLQSERFQLAQQLQDADLARESLSQWMIYDPENHQLRKIFDELPVKKTP